MGLTFKCSKFMFNGVSFDKFNIMICSFDQNRGIVVSNEVGSVTIDTAKTSGNDKWNYIKSDYDSPLISKFSICKKDGAYFTPIERRTISGILQSAKGGYKQLQFFGDEYRDVIFYAKCTTIEKNTLGCEVVGYNLTFTTNAPYGFSKEYTSYYNMQSSTLNTSISNTSDEFESLLFPKLKITIKENCDFSLKNNRMNRTFKIDDCITGEIITVDPNTGYVYSSVREESVIDDFNCIWFATIRDVFDSNNSITITGMADVEITCAYPRKVGV